MDLIKPKRDGEDTLKTSYTGAADGFFFVAIINFFDLTHPQGEFPDGL